MSSPMNTRQPDDCDDLQLQRYYSNAPVPHRKVEVHIPLLSNDIRAQYAHIEPIVGRQDSPVQSTTRTAFTRPRTIVKKEEEDVDLLGDNTTEPLPRPAVDDKPDQKPPNIKKEPGVLILPHDSVQRRLHLNNCSPLGNIQVDRDVSNVWFKRRSLATILGGNMQVMASEPNKILFGPIHSLGVILYPVPAWNPHAPRARGEPGLILSRASPAAAITAVPLFIQLPRRRRAGSNDVSTNEKLWYYMGHYIMKEADPLSKLEWALLGDEVRNNFLDGLRKSTWGGSMRAEVTFCVQHNRRPNDNEYKVIRGAVAQKKRKRSNRKDDEPEVRHEMDFPVTNKQIDEYLREGWGELEVSTLNCHNYDLDFQRMLIARNQMHAEGLLEAEYAEIRRKVEERKQVESVASAGRPAKRRKTAGRISSEGLEGSPDNEGSYEDPDDEVEYGDAAPAQRDELVYVPRGTKLRPILVRE